MILLDRPYVSKHFLNYLERSGQPVLETRLRRNWPATIA